MTEKDTASGWTLLEGSILQPDDDSLEEFLDVNDFAVGDFDISETSSDASECEKENCEIGDSSSAPSLSCSTVSLDSLSSTEHSLPLLLLRSKRLTFGQVSVHQHNVTIGDNPSCSHGPPISLDWTRLCSDSYNLDEYEAMTQQSRGKAKRLGRLERETLLKESGYSTHAMDRVTEQVDHEKMIRTVQKMQLDEMEEYQVMASASIRRLRRTNDVQPTFSPRTHIESSFKGKRMPLLSRFLRKSRDNATLTS